MTIARATVVAAVDKAMTDNPALDLLAAVEVAAQGLALPPEAVLEAVTAFEEVPAC